MKDLTINTVEDIEYLTDEMSYVTEDFDIAKDEYDDTSYECRVESKLNLLTVLRDCISRIDYIFSIHSYATDELRDKAKAEAEALMLDFINRATDLLQNY